MQEFLVGEGTAFVGKENAEASTRVYSFSDFDIEIDVETTYDDKLAEVRRSRAETQRTEAGAPAASGDLSNRALPEDIADYLDVFPQKSLIHKIILLDTAVLGEPLRDCTTSQSGSWIYLQDATVGDSTKRALLHSWCHLAMDKLPIAVKVFAHAARLEEVDTVDGAQLSLAENWALHFSDYFLSPDFDKFEAFCVSAPLRAIALARGLRQVLSTVIGRDASSMLEQMQERVQYVEDRVLPEARAIVRGHLSSGELNPPAVAMAFYIGLKDSLYWKSTENLDLSGELLTEAELSAVLNENNFPELRTLDLSETLLGRDGLQVVAPMPSLQALSVANTGVESLTCAGELFQLSALDLSGTRVDSAALAHLTKCKTLKSLNVQNTEVTELGVETVRKHLPECDVRFDV